ncbi:MAG: ExeM/NucH family extracellular endonuclease [Caldilineaceae bacterium]
MHELRQVLRKVAAVLLALCAGVLAALSGYSGAAQADGAVNLTGPHAAYSQSFDALASKGASAVLPLGWGIKETGSAATADGRYRAFTPGSGAGDTYSFGTGGSSERAFGGLRSDDLTPLFGAKFTNNTGAAIEALAIGYTGEQWRLGAPNRGPDRLDFQFSTDATSLTTGTWRDYDGLDFLSPTTSGSAGALDGNAPANRRAAGATIPGLSIADGQSFWLRWVDADIPGADDGLAIDDFLLTPLSGPCAEAYTPIYQIQGAGATAAITGTVSTQGVVVGDYEGPSPALRGFYLQDAGGDGNPATSDGIFVFNGSNADSVNLGDVVRITGRAGENQGQTQVSVTAEKILKCGTGTVAPVDVTLPLSSTTALEQFEGMLVRFPQPLYVTEHFQLGRFGQVVLSAGGRLAQPTNIVAPGAPAQAQEAANSLNRIVLDDASQAQNTDPIVFARGGQPLAAGNTLRGGDSAEGIVGVLTYTWGGDQASPNAYRVRPIKALGGGANFAPTNPRPVGAPPVSGHVRVAGMNLLNFFNTFDGLPDKVDNCRNGVGGAAADCRGADAQAEFDRQWPKTVAAITGSGADIIGVMELENDGYGPGSAIRFLVDQLNTATAPDTYAFVDVDAATDQVDALGNDAIRVGLIYKPAKVTPAGRTAVLNTPAFVTGGDGEARNRPSLAQAFEEKATGERFIVAVNHLKSKGSACAAPDTGDGQGNCAAVRTQAANLLAQWLATDPTGTGDLDVLLIGDFNSYAQEDPITALKNAGYTNLIESLNGSSAYSYAFNGEWGYLDHALASASLVPQVASVADWHINADEPAVLDYNTDFKTPAQRQSLYAPDVFRISDHDPVLVDLNLAQGASPAAVAMPTTGADSDNVWVLFTIVLVLLGLGVSVLVTRRTAA